MTSTPQRPTGADSTPSAAVLPPRLPAHPQMDPGTYRICMDCLGRPLTKYEVVTIDALPGVTRISGSICESCKAKRMGRRRRRGDA